MACYLVNLIAVHSNEKGRRLTCRLCIVSNTHWCVTKTWIIIKEVESYIRFINPSYLSHFSIDLWFSLLLFCICHCFKSILIAYSDEGYNLLNLKCYIFFSFQEGSQSFTLAFLTTLTFCVIIRLLWVSSPMKATLLS